jgi:hypothetical protein
MKHSLNKSVLALVCAVGLASAPHVKAADETTMHPMVTRVGTALIAWEVLSLLHMAKKGSKADFKQRDFLDMSPALLTKNPKEWAKNAARNLEIAQSDYFEGQGHKGASLKLNHEGKLEQGKKCFPHGFNGQLIGLVVAVNKGLKSSKEIATVVVAAMLLRKAPIKWDLLAPLFGCKDLQAAVEGLGNAPAAHTDTE